MHWLSLLVFVAIAMGLGYVMYTAYWQSPSSYCGMGKAASGADHYAMSGANDHHHAASGANDHTANYETNKANYKAVEDAVNEFYSGRNAAAASASTCPFEQLGAGGVQKPSDFDAVWNQLSSAHNDHHSSSAAAGVDSYDHAALDGMVDDYMRDTY